MRVALYYPWVYLRSGIERMILETVKRSEHDWVIFTSHYYPEQTFPEFQELPIIELSKVSVNRRYSAVGNAAVTILRQKINLDDFDALVVSSEGLGDLITFRNHSVPVVCYCHTPLKVIHDPFARRRYLETHHKLAPAFLLLSAIFKIADHFAWKHYRYVFCNSEEVRKRIIGARLAPAEIVEVLPPGLDTERMTPYDDYQKYFLVVGRIKWWKNLELAVESFIEFRRRNPQFHDFSLQIVGLVEPRSEDYYQRLREMAGGRDDIIFKRDPTEEELLDSYRHSYALLFPSLNEDWGMVPLEAMGFGKPVVAVNQGGPAESVLDEETGFLVKPEIEDFVSAMARLAADPDLTRRLGLAGAEHVKKFDWSLFVERLDSYISTLKV